MIFEPLQINDVVLNNRITVAPMCQYSASMGNPTTWHYGHLFNLIKSGVGMVMTESIAVTLDGRITHNCLASETNENNTGLNSLFQFLKSEIPLGVQLSHSGRKGSSYVPWDRYNSSLELDGWDTVSASAIPRDDGWPKPTELTSSGIEGIVASFSGSAKILDSIGFEILEIHMAHGYLLHQFFSPISNKRNDSYGGSLKNRCKFLLSVSEMVRTVWPEDKVLGASVTGTDWLDGGSTIEDCVYLTQELKDIGFDYVCVSSGGILPVTNLPNNEPKYQVHLSREIKKSVYILTKTAGCITTMKQVDDILKSGSADMVAIGRQIIQNPTWLYDNEKLIPIQYKKCFERTL